MEDNFKHLLELGKKPVLCEITVEGKTYHVSWDGGKLVVEEWLGFDDEVKSEVKP